VSAERIDWRDVPARPWKNGAGETRDIACEPLPADADGDFAWRISVAEIARDAPFSRYPGIDRCIVLLQGAGMHLREAGGAWKRRLDQAFEPFRFAGEAEVAASLVDGASQDLNVMTRRGRWRSDVTTWHDAASVPAADAGVLLCGRGRWTVDALDDPLEAMQACVWRERMPPLQARPDAPAGALIAIRLLRGEAAR
jgi:environmental stress-induced protein Ves